ncbi:MAG TPA: hypothetical protein PKC24_13395 [Cyclobacteriaceae bacterium]|nr:hypothetical protein [Cyclobacteriaceae bacterium]
MNLLDPSAHQLFITIALVIAALYGFALRYALFNKFSLPGKLICLMAVFLVPVLGALVITIYFWKHPEEL